uniref:Uncharacterized protein n=1 Tax=Nicotiana tabacum TaxID=4097 RepID=A0A1S3Z4T0_TOBAC|nr:PREDICTED: uncharacterized protein LOC107782955 [Nicotiana tabacum]
MRNIMESWFPRPIRSDPGKKDPNLWCEYHGTHGHRTGNCRHLREELETLLKNIHLREFLSDQAKNNYGPKKTKVSVTHSKKLREVAEDDITFTKEDADGLLLPHNDALVISLNVLDFKIKRILFDLESSATSFNGE